MSDNTTTEQEAKKNNTQVTPSNDEVIVVMDGYAGDWTPSAVMTDPSEAATLRDMLSKDAEAVCSLAPWYETKQDVRDGNTTETPTDIPDELSVCFNQDTALAVSENDWATREMQFEKGGLRGSVTVFETAKEVAAEKPAVTGRFIEASDTAIEDILDSIQ